ncbi:MAG: monovalent cation/H+ antiporter complex subunit F [Alphaproteobacteria bacterium]|nr:monovalent cation/H+ antiporter complex subunit F [Alphaproteobacteria bacterium]
MTPETLDPILAGSWVAGGILALSSVIALYRVVFGPTPADRVIAVDLLTMLLVGLVVVVAVTHNVFAILDVALAVAILAFLATIGFARYLLRSHVSEQEAAGGST